jgi:hypothetical protein
MSQVSRKDQQDNGPFQDSVFLPQRHRRNMEYRNKRTLFWTTILSRIRGA